MEKPTLLSWLKKKTKKPPELPMDKGNADLWTRRQGSWSKSADSSPTKGKKHWLNEDDKKSFLSRWWRSGDEALNNPILHLASLSMTLQESSGYMQVLDEQAAGLSDDSIHDLSLEEKIQRAFELPQKEAYKGEFACWLVKSVLLKGYLYITEGHVCFCAELEGQVKKAGYLQKRYNNLNYTYWMVLKNNVLYTYANSSDLYYPQSALALEKVIDIRPSKSTLNGFTIETDKKKVHLTADTELLRNEWMQALNAQVFRAKNFGEDVRIVLPLRNISQVDIEHLPLESGLRIRLQDETMTEDYFFSYFTDLQKAHDTIKQLVKEIHNSKAICMFDTTSTSHLPPKPRGHRKSLSDAQRPTELFAAPAAEKELIPLPRKHAPSLPHHHHHSSSESSVHVVQEDTFRDSFAIPLDDALVGSFTCYLVKLLPRIGKMYLTEQHVLFQSRLVGIRAKLILPVADIAGCKKTGYFSCGLVITTKNQEEIYFDFHSSEVRNRCHSLLMTVLQVHSSRGFSSGSGRLSAVLDDIDRQDHHVKSTFHADEIAYVQPLSVSKVIPPPMHITCLTIGTRGDVQPYIALCKRFMADGHTCRLATHLEYKEWIEGFGIEFSEVKGNPAELMQLCVDNGMFTVSFIREGLSKFKGWIDELLVSCWDAVQGTDLLIESPTAMGGVHCAEKMQIPFFSTFTMPWTRTRAYPHPFAVPDHNLGGSYNLMTHVMIEQIFSRGVSSQINRWRKNVLDLPYMPPTSLSDLKFPFLYSFSPSVVPPPADWPDWIHLTGYWFLDNPELNWDAPSSLVEFMQAGPCIYIGFGSIVVPDPDELTRVIIDSVVKAGIRAILSKGWSGRLKSSSEKIDYPSCIYPIDKVPHDWLFPQMQGVVHHGGAGTTSAGLRAGVPTLIHPFFGDQFFWAERIQELGVGLSVRKLTVDRLSTALKTLVTDTKIREKAILLGETIRNESGLDNAVDNVYRDMEYARKRINALNSQ